MTNDLIPGSPPLVGWTDPTLSVQHIWILKNGTNFVRYHAEQLHWQLKSIPLNKRISRFAILRDPYRRWLVGFTQDIKQFIYARDTVEERDQLLELFQNNLDWLLEFLLDRDILFFDTHAHLQIKTLEPILQVCGQENITFFQMNDRLGYYLNHWLHGEGVTNKFNNGKINATDEKNDILFNKISNFLMDAKNRKRKDKVIEYLQPDYELINSVRFFNGN